MSAYTQYIQMVDKHRDLIFAAEKYLWEHPAPGYKEWPAHEYLKAEFEKLGYELFCPGDIPGFYTDLDTGRPGPTVLLMGELDSLIVASHPACDPKTGAVHACGHHAQVAGLLGVAAALKEPGALDGLCGKIRLMAVPAEELIEIEWREEQRKAGKIRYFGGKQEFIHRGYMDGVDFNSLIHTSTAPAGTASISVGQNGFITKSITFHGVSAHAAAPSRGVNALYAANAAMTAINSLRETFKDSEHIRVHPIITMGGTVVNAIPETVTMESFVRGATVDAIVRENAKVNRAIAASALALGGNVTISDRPGYMPNNNDPECKKVAIAAMAEVVGAENVQTPTLWGNGSTDMGDMSTIIPTAYIHVGGAVGRAHGNNYYIEDVESCCVNAAKILMLEARMMLENNAERLVEIKKNFKPVFASKEEYRAALDAMVLDGQAVTYHEDGTASIRFSN